MQAYFFTGFPASIESGISETLSLGGKFLSLAENPFIFIEFRWKILILGEKSLSLENFLSLDCLEFSKNRWKNKPAIGGY